MDTGSGFMSDKVGGFTIGVGCFPNTNGKRKGGMR